METLTLLAGLSGLLYVLATGVTLALVAVGTYVAVMHPVGHLLQSWKSARTGRLPAT